MEAVKRTKFRSFLNNCMSGRDECSASQMRGGFLVLNLLVWVVILASFELLS